MRTASARSDFNMHPVALRGPGTWGGGAARSSRRCRSIIHLHLRTHSERRHPIATEACPVAYVLLRRRLSHTTTAAEHSASNVDDRYTPAGVYPACSQGALLRWHSPPRKGTPRPRPDHHPP